MKEKAFTLTEMVVAVAVMSIMAGVMALNSATVGQQSAQKEAERVAAYIQGHISRSNIGKRGFGMTVNTNKLDVKTGLSLDDARAEKSLEAFTGCSYALYEQSGTSYQASVKSQLRYNIKPPSLYSQNWKSISEDSTVYTSIAEEGSYYITVKGADGKFCNVIIRR